MNTRTKKLLAALAMGSMMMGTTGMALADSDSQETFSEYSKTGSSLEIEFDRDGDRDFRRGPNVPESQTWAMLGIGVGLVVLQLRRRGKRFHKSDLA